MNEQNPDPTAAAEVEAFVNECREVVAMMVDVQGMVSEGGNLYRVLQDPNVKRIFDLGVVGGATAAVQVMLRRHQAEGGPL